MIQDARILDQLNELPIEELKTYVLGAIENLKTLTKDAEIDRATKMVTIASYVLNKRMQI